MSLRRVHHETEPVWTEPEPLYLPLEAPRPPPAADEPEEEEEEHVIIIQVA